MRRRTREFRREIFCFPLFLLLSSTLTLSHDHQCDFYEMRHNLGFDEYEKTLTRSHDQLEYRLSYQKICARSQVR